MHARRSKKNGAHYFNFGSGVFDMNSQQKITLTSGSLSRNILLFSIPLMLSNVLQVLFNMSDIAVVGRFAGSHALGSVGSTSILVTLFTGFLIGIGSGINVTVARYLGCKSYKDVSETVHTSALLCLIIGVIALLIGVLGARPMMQLLGTKDELIDGAILYLQIYFLGMPALSVYNFGNAVLSAAGDTRRTLIIMVVAGVVNVILNLFFVIVCKLSVAGVAIASAVSQYMSAVLIVRLLVKTNDSYALHINKLRITREKARFVLSLSLPAGLQNAIFQIANLFIQASVNTFPAVVVEGNSAAANADALVYDVMAAFYTACSSFMSQNFGAGNRKRVINSYYISLAYSFGIGALLGGALLLFGDKFLMIFTTDPDVVEMGMDRLWVMGFSYAFSAFMDCTISASRGIGKSAVPTAIVIMGACVFRVIWVCTVFAYFHTIMSLYLLYIFSWTITSVAEIIYFRYSYRKKMAMFPAEA